MSYFSRIIASFLDKDGNTTAVSETDRLPMELPDDFQILMAENIEQILVELKKTNLYLEEILGDKL
jgi:hypothetical protein